MNNVVPFFPSITQIISDNQINTRRISDLLNSAFIDHETEQDGALKFQPMDTLALLSCINSHSKFCPRLHVGTASGAHLNIASERGHEYSLQIRT